MSTILEGYSKREISRLRTKFWAHVHQDGRDHDIPDAVCWEWHGSTFRDGSPAAATKNRTHPARFIAYALEVDDFEEGHYILAMCRNKLCVNPKHMRLARRRSENDATAKAKREAAQAVNTAVWSYGSLPKASACQCAICGQAAHHYHHYLGYEPEHWLDVIPLCRPCHRRSEWTILRESGPAYHV